MGYLVLAGLLLILGLQTRETPKRVPVRVKSKRKIPKK